MFDNNISPDDRLTNLLAYEKQMICITQPSPTIAYYDFIKQLGARAKCFVDQNLVALREKEELSSWCDWLNDVNTREQSHEDKIIIALSGHV